MQTLMIILAIHVLSFETRMNDSNRMMYEKGILDSFQTDQQAVRTVRFTDGLHCN